MRLTIPNISIVANSLDVLTEHNTKHLSSTWPIQTWWGIHESLNIGSDKGLSVLVAKPLN